MQVKSTEAPHLSPALLKVVNARPEGAQARLGISERHLIPYVPEIVQEIDQVANAAFIQPPKGLLNLGRQQLLLDIIEPRIMVRLVCFVQEVDRLLSRYVTI